MKVIKPQRLAALTRAITLDGRTYQLAIGVLAYVPLAEPRALGMEVSLWKAAADHIQGSPDEGYAKPTCEVLVSGSVVAPEGATLTVAKPRLVVRRDDETLIDKSVAVFGNRYWVGQRMTEPTPFTELPLHWSSAYGGADHPLNPSGKGLHALDTESGPAHPLPNLEHPDRLIVSPDDRPAPAGLGPIEVASPMRMRYAGKDYGDDWLESRFPGPALDFDPRFFQSAPEDQRLPSPWTGTETIRIEGFVPGPPLTGTLPPLVVKALVGRRRAQGDGTNPPALESYALRLETVHVLPNAGSAIVIYRGVIDIESDDADDIAHLMVAAESPEHPKPTAHYQEVLAGRLDLERGPLLSLRDADLMPPEAEGWSCRPDYGTLPQQLTIEYRALERAERGRQASLAEAREELRAAGFTDVDQAFAEPDWPSAPDDPLDIEALIAYADEAEQRTAKYLAEAEKESAEAEKAARTAFDEAGFDYDAETARAQTQAAGPPSFQAGRHLSMLHDMARIASEGGEPMDDLERDLMDAAYVDAMFALERSTRETYRASAHLMPSAGPASEADRQQMRALVQAAKDGHESLSGRDLTGADLSGLQLDGMDLSGVMLEGANLDEANLSEANLQQAVLTRASLTETVLRGANLREANLGDTQLTRTDLAEADLRGVTFMQSHLIDVQLSNAVLDDVEFLEAKLDRVLFISSKATKLCFYKVDLRGCTFVGAQLPEAQFLECDLREVAFSHGTLEQSQFIHCLGGRSMFTEANLRGVTFATLPDKDTASDFDGADFACADLSRANLQGTSFKKAAFTEAKLTEANLRKAKLQGADLSRATARGALMVRADFAHASLQGADLLGALFHQADLRSANLGGCNLSRSDLGLAWLDEQTAFDEALMLDTKMVPARKEDEATR